MNFFIASRLATIWEKILNHRVGVQDNFFEVGGNSFLALRLGEEIGREFNKALPVGIVFYLPTIEQLTKYLDGEEQLPAGVSLVPLQTEGDGRPIFVVHWTVRDLVRHLGKERPIYALSYGMATSDPAEFPEHVEDLAQHYIEEMRQVQPAGPYTLIGYSAGGVVAFEMAHQLRDRKETVDFLGLIDSYIPRDFFFQGTRLPLHRQIANVFKLSPREMYNSFRFWYLDPWLQKLHLSYRWVTHSDFVMSNTDFWMSYEPRPYAGKLTLFKAQGIQSVRNQRIPPEQFWAANSEAEIHEVPGRHLSVVYYDPNARVLAAKLKECLAVPRESADHCEYAPDAERTQLTAFMRYCAAATGHDFTDYWEFDRFAVNEFRSFWYLFLSWSGLRWNGDPEPICEDSRCETATFFPGLHLNYAENLLDGNPYDPAITVRHHSGSRQRLTRGELLHEVIHWADGLTRLGVRRGDRVVAIARNNVEVVISALAAARIGATFASCPTDMSASAILARFSQLTPKVLLTNVRPQPGDTGMTLPAKVAEVVEALPSLTAVVAFDDGELAVTAPVYHMADLAIWSIHTGFWQRHPFNHPLFILFSSGTTGAPKCIVHGTGGTLLEHLKEHRLHCDLKAGDKLFFQTSCGWMMWNWQLSALATGTELVLYDGPMEGPETLWRIVAEEQVTVFGTSAAFLRFCQTAGYSPKQEVDLSALRGILSTGSILYPAQFDWVHENVKSLPLQSISGGTDIIGCFVLGNPNLPVNRGEAQCRSLGLDVRALLPEGAVDAHIGELICCNPFPSRPIGFYGDDGSRFHEAYFSQHPFAWVHGDLVETTEHIGWIMRGRSDGVLNIRGVRVGPAEIYGILQNIGEIADAMAIEQEIAAELGGAQLVLLIVLREGCEFTPILDARIRYELFTNGSAAHVPAKVIEVKELPVTHSGKRSETAARDALNGRPVRNRDALANPGTLDEIAALKVD